MKLSLILFLIAVLSLSACKNEPAPNNFYVFSHFNGLVSDSTGNGQDGLHLALSEDLFNWTAANGGVSLLRPQVGRTKLMRDPCIAQGSDGTFHMVWTVSWREPVIGYASSKDLINWSEQKAITPFENEPEAQNCWAPELTWDPDNGHWMIYWSTTIPGKFPETDNSNINNWNHRIYYTLTRDFEEFTPTEMLYEPGFNVIDASIYRDKDRWVMFVKDETRHPEVAKNIKLAYSKNLAGPYTPASEPITHQWVEGPTALLTDSLWYLFYDEYPATEGGLFRIRLISSPDLENWTDLSDRLIMPESMRHGTIIRVNEKIYRALKAL
jgi:beta-xylosidase